VSGGAGGPGVATLRQVRLAHLVSSQIVEALSLGYSPEELEVAFSLHLARWREERAAKAESLERKDGQVDARKTIVIVGSHDLALQLLAGQLRRRNPELSVEITHAGSLAGLIALQEERADLAGIHLLDEETGEYNYPYVKHILPGREVAIVHLAYRIQGLMFARGNPRRIQGLADLTHADITFANRQKGSGTRVLLDLKLQEQGITPSEVRGYEREMDTHLAVATAIARGEVDVGLGIEAAANTCNIDFLPLFRERYDLVIPIANYRGKLVPLLEIVGSEDFRKAVTDAGGYDTSQTGATAFYNHNN